MSITISRIDRAIDRYRNLKVGEKEYKNIAGILVDEISSKASHSKVMELIELFISAEAKPMYLNEVKNYLFENDRALYERYARMFLKNPGVFEAFGVHGEKRGPIVQEKGPVVFKSLKPKLNASTKRKSKTTRKAIQKESKISAYHKIMREKSASIEYQKKIDAMYRKVRKEQ
ncbi:hypothetical protein EHEL_040290 [Encephalitozoon hellem ATCC 50504]|uniref:Uncharacterized protein n=1 Tax=Encephalitozoon hellem TaxID=27973 RepID=A0A9Q9F9B6_ENCHE|nr:uncharacterized protein EHEL_040290 [Encephalitozoon hellem ATCC 50504]AFM98081.1 hypothetical protein EHEL_040290 [Encephalitozoon hellem ATCC 50504]UTX42922.1 hypothetical protein GPU96_04g06520 [Encephalitozoon hellem]WEL38379.1 hypothetical protein PFJ87_04g00500 [Encephalitozoon hellem]|eukprot:XP_003887062.1 hypothetical protein EHEL_040290 [Encephalitozoon hellem ATCC 50504]